MPVSYSLGPNPRWYFVDNTGRPLAGGMFFTFSSLNPSVRKFVFEDNQGNFPWPDPVIIDANGTAGPFWFQVDSDNPDDAYLIIVQDANGNEVWSVDNYLPGSGGGGGGGSTIGVHLKNLVTNNVFYRHCDTTTPVPLYTVVAPSNNAGLINNSSILTDLPNPSPDIVFLKGNTSATDSISFPEFTPLGDQALAPDETPVDAFNYTCSVGGTSELIKCLQFPMSSKVQNLSDQTISGYFWAIASGALPQQIILEWFQYFGDGAGASTPVITAINTYSLTTTWTRYNIQTLVPSIIGKTLGAPSFGGASHTMPEGPNDGLFLRIQFPLSPNTCDITLTKPSLFLGNIVPTIDYTSYDEIDSIISSPRTGDVRVSMNAFAPFGWVACNDGVLSNGNPAIVLPTGIPSARNNEDTYPLFYLIWTQVLAINPSFVQLYDSAGGPTTTLGSAILDFAASYQLALTKTLGRAISSVGLANGQTTTWNLGQFGIGAETHTQTIGEMPTHNHPGSTVPFSNVAGSRGGSGSDTVIAPGPEGVTVAPQGSAVPFNIIQPTSFWNVFLKL
jgi:hypothetical protein